MANHLVLQPIPMDRTTETFYMLGEFHKVALLGITNVMQFFPQGFTELQVANVMDMAAIEGLTVWAGVYTDPGQMIMTWNGTEWDLGEVGRLLGLFAQYANAGPFQSIDEPFARVKNVTAYQVTVLHNQIKAIAPDTANLVGYSKQIAYGVNGGNPDFMFGPGQCDYAMIGGLAFRNYGTGDVYEEADQRLVDELSRPAIAAVPGVTFVHTLQCFGGHRKGEPRKSSYYMPPATEFQSLIDLVRSPDLEALKPVNWYAWQQWAPRQSKMLYQTHTVGEPEYADLRQIISDTVQL